MVLQTLRGFFQRDLGDRRIPFYLVAVATMVLRQLVTSRRLVIPSTSVGMTSDGASAPVAMVTVVLPPPSDCSTWGAPVRWVVGHG
jgi:hypothetical protein